MWGWVEVHNRNDQVFFKSSHQKQHSGWIDWFPSMRPMGRCLPLAQDANPTLPDAPVPAHPSRTAPLRVPDHWRIRRAHRFVFSASPASSAPETPVTNPPDSPMGPYLIPTDLPDSVSVLEHDQTVMFLVGTAHVSSQVRLRPVCSPHPKETGHGISLPRCGIREAPAASATPTLVQARAHTCVRGCPPHEGALATVRARCELWVYLGTLPVIIAPIQRPLGKKKGASGIYWQPLRKSGKTGLVGRRLWCTNTQSPSW